MSKLFITGDVHLNEWDEFSTILPNGVNSRLQVGLDALKQITEAAAGQTLVVAGDLFHTREEVSVQVLFRAGEAIKYASQICERVILLVGNHDQHLKDGRVHSLKTFEAANVSVIDQPTVMDIGRSVLFMPYMADYQEFSEAYSGLSALAPMSILHADIMDFEMNSGFVSTRGITPRFCLEAGNPKSALRLCISGHYHKPQKLEGFEVYYVGSPYQIDRSEAGHQKRYLVVDENLSVESHEFQGLPVFRKVSLSEAKSIKETKDFVDVACNEEDARKGWSEQLPANFNVVLESTKSGASDFTSVELSGAVQGWLKREGREDLLELAMERLSRNA